MYQSQVQQAIDSISAQGNEFFANTVDRGQLLSQSQKVLQNLDSDVQRIKTEGAILFAPATNTEVAGQKIAEAFDKWRENPPSTVALMIVAAEKFGIDMDSPNFKGALMTGLASQVRHDNAYHDTSHFREVTAVMVRLVGANNELAATGTKGTELLDGNDIAKCLACAASHDLLHDGKGNTVGGVHEQYRLENKAIGAAEPFMKLAGVSEKDMEDIRVMIRITDISADNSKKPEERIPSPHRQLRAAYAEAYEGGKPAVVQPELEALRKDPKLLVVAAMMSDADLGPSAATDYAFSRKMTGLVAKETPALSDSDITLKGFMQFVVDNRFTSQAGTDANGASLKGIFNEASKRVEAQQALQNKPPVSDAEASKFGKAIEKINQAPPATAAKKLPGQKM